MPARRWNQSQSAEGHDTVAQPRNLTRCCILMKNTLGHAAHKLRLGNPKSCLGSGLVAGGESLFHLLHIIANPAATVAVYKGRALGLADPFLRLR